MSLICNLAVHHYIIVFISYYRKFETVFRAFRQLLFADDEPVASKPANTHGGSPSGILGPPSRTRLSTLPYVSAIRPSTLLAFLSSSAPVQVYTCRSCVCLYSLIQMTCVVLRAVYEHVVRSSPSITSASSAPSPLPCLALSVLTCLSDLVA